LIYIYVCTGLAEIENLRGRKGRRDNKNGRKQRREEHSVQSSFPAHPAPQENLNGFLETKVLWCRELFESLAQYHQVATTKTGRYSSVSVGSRGGARTQMESVSETI
jgi:hypothetical protein